MHIQQIRLSHFKCFKELKVDCSKFTLLAGANSSGKSSILHGLLGAIQTKDFPLYFSPNGSYVSMGDFEELAFSHSPEQPFGIGLTLEGDEGSRFILDSRFAQNPETKLPRLVSLDYSSPAFSFSVSKSDRNGVYTAKYRYEPEKEPGWRVAGSDAFKKAMLGLFQAAESASPKEPKKKGSSTFLMGKRSPM